MIGKIPRPLSGDILSELPAGTLVVFYDEDAFFAQSRAELFDSGCRFDVSMMKKSAFYASILSDVPNFRTLYKSGSLEKASELFSNPRLAEWLPEDPLLERLAIVEAVLPVAKKLFAAGIELKVEPQKTLLFAARILLDGAEARGEYFPFEAVSLAARILKSNPELRIRFLDERPAVLFFDFPHFEPDELELLDLLALRADNTRFVIHVPQIAEGRMFAHRRALLESLTQNADPLETDEKEPCAAALALGVWPKPIINLDGLVPVKASVAIREARGEEVEADKIAEAVAARLSAGCVPLLLSAEDAGLDRLASAAMSAGLPASGRSARRLSQSLAYGRFALPFESLSAMYPDDALTVEIALTLAGGSGGSGLRIRAREYAERLKEGSDACGSGEIAPFFDEADKLSNALKTSSGEALRQAASNWLNKIIAGIDDSIEDAATSDGLFELAAAAALKRAFDACPAGDELDFKELCAFVRGLGGASVSKFFERGEFSAIIAGAQTPPMTDESVVIFAGCESGKFPPPPPPFPLGESFADSIEEPDGLKIAMRQRGNAHCLSLTQERIAQHLCRAKELALSSDAVSKGNDERPRSLSLSELELVLNKLGCFAALEEPAEPAAFGSMPAAKASEGEIAAAGKAAAQQALAQYSNGQILPDLSYLLDCERDFCGLARADAQKRVEEALQRELRATSATFIEDFIKCPRFALVKRVLKLEPDEEETAGMNAADEGSLSHEILRDFYRGCIRDSGRESTSLQECGGLKSALDRLYQTTGEAVRMMGGRALGMNVRLYRRLARLIKRDYELQRTEGWRVALLEERFSAELRDESGAFLLEGNIDRVDVNPSMGALKIIDYKTGSVPVSGKKEGMFRPPKSAGEFWGVQMPLYLYLVRRGDLKGADKSGFESKRFVEKLAPKSISAELFYLKDAAALSAGPGAKKPNELDAYYAAWDEAVPAWETALIEAVAKVRRRVKEGYFPPLPDSALPACSYCAVRAGCAARRK